MTKPEAEELVRPYVGKVIEEIGTHIPDKSVYNYDGDIDCGNKIWVGGQQDDGYGLMLGEFT